MTDHNPAGTGYKAPTRREQLDSLLNSIKAAAEATGIAAPEQTARWGVETGSRTYGRAYRLYQTGSDNLDHYRAEILTEDERARDPYPYGSGHFPAAGLNGHLGMTHDEAVRSLRRILDTLWAVQRGVK